MYASRPSAASNSSSTTTTSTMSSMTSGAASSVDSRSAFSLHRQKSLSSGHQRSKTEPQLSSTSPYPTRYPSAYSPAGEPEDAPFLGTPFALERVYEYPFPSPDVDYLDFSRGKTGAAAAVAAQSVLPSLSYSTPSSSVLAQSLLSSGKLSVEGGGLANTNPNAAKKREQVTRENLAKRRATTGNILHPLNIPQAATPPIPPALLSREHAGQLSPILAQMSPGLLLGIPSPRLFRSWRGDENGHRNDTTKRTR